MIKVYDYGKSEIPCSIEHYLDYALNGVTDTSDYRDTHASLDYGNYLDLLKLITLKLCAANIISEQELLDTLGLSGAYRNPYYKAEQ